MWTKGWNTTVCTLCVVVVGWAYCSVICSGDPWGSWIATPDYLRAGASTRKVIPRRQIESLSRLSPFLKFLHPASLAFYLLSQSLPLRHVNTHFLLLLYKHTALLSKPPLFLQHPCFTLPLPPPAILSHVPLPPRPFSPPLFHFSFIILFKRHSGLMKTALIIRWHNSAISAVFSFSPLLHEMGWTGARNLCLNKSFHACFICVILWNTAAAAKLFTAVLWPLLCYSPLGELNSTSPQIQFAARARSRLKRREVAAFSNPSVQRDFIVSVGVSDSSSGRRRAVSPQQQ